MPCEEVTFRSRDGLRLKGWMVPHPEARAGIILCHGHPFNRSEMMWWARALYPAGYHLFLFDFRALGESEGRVCTIGAHEVSDLLGAADTFTARPEMRGLPLGVMGFSMGGAVAIMTAARDHRFRAVATHGAYASLDRALQCRCRLLAGPLAPALYHPTRLWARLWHPEDLRFVAPVDDIHALAPRPVLLMHGARDVLVRPEHARLLYAAAAAPKSLHLWPDTWHANIGAGDQPRYREVLADFFDRAFAADGLLPHPAPPERNAPEYAD